MAHPLHRERREELRVVTAEVIGERLHHRDEVGAQVAGVGQVVFDARAPSRMASTTRWAFEL